MESVPNPAEQFTFPEDRGDERDTCSSFSIGKPAERPTERMMISASPCPRVVMRPVFTPLSWTIALVPTVVPCSNNLVLCINWDNVSPNFSAATSRALKNPSAKSFGVDGLLAIVICPRSFMTTQSVKVPPVSTPQKYCMPVSPDPIRARRALTTDSSAGVLST
jgi:hypothetical protein